jgi:hypothetical protein
MTCRCGYEFCWTCGQEWTRNHLSTICHRPAPRESDTTHATVDNENVGRLRIGNRPDPNAPNSTVAREGELTRRIAIRPDPVAHSQIGTNIESARSLRERELEQRVRIVERLGTREAAQDPVATSTHEIMEEDVPLSRMFASVRWVSLLDDEEDDALISGIVIQDVIAQDATVRSKRRRRTSSRREKRTSSRTRRARGRSADDGNRSSSWVCCFQF